MCNTPIELAKSMSADNKLPKHLAIIMDGNGRWAKTRNLSRSEGHKAGVKTAREIVLACAKIGIPSLTLYTFSKENWGRPKDEVALLFDLLVNFLQKELSFIQKENIRLNILGDLEGLPKTVQFVLKQSIESTKQNTGILVNLAINYSGRDEILQAVRLCIKDGLKEEQITEEVFREKLYTKQQADPDLVIRTSGEQRLSNFLPFQCAYAELIFSPLYWPDFTPEDLKQALECFASRNRRFGLTQEQL